MTTIQYDPHDIEMAFLAHLEPVLTDLGVSYKVVQHRRADFPEGFDCILCGAYVRIPNADTPTNLILHWVFHADMLG